MGWKEDAAADAHQISVRLMRAMDNELLSITLEYHAELQRVYDVLMTAKTLEQARERIIGESA